MTGVEETTLLYYVGLIVEVLSVGLTALLFQLLRHQSGRRRYFRIWADAWVVLTLSLIALIPFMSHRAQVLLDRADQSPAMVAGYTLYQLGKWIFLWLLVGGTHLYAHGGRWRRRLFWGLAGSTVCALLSVAATSSFARSMLVQGVALVLAMLYCARTMFLLPKERRTLGSALTGMACLAKALLWVAELPYFWNVAMLQRQAISGPLNTIGKYGSFGDLILQIILSFGMVLILMEETTREKTAAIDELALSYDEFKREALRDPLSGALNRRAFFENVGIRSARATYGSVGLFDLDNLKKTNDRHGHSTGDALIRTFARAVQVCLGPEDRLYRWGGDEFLVILPNVSAIEAQEAFEVCPELHQSIEAPDGTLIHLEASLGLADYGGSASLEEALEEADRRMYASKKRRKSERAVRDPNVPAAAISEDRRRPGSRWNPSSR